MWHVGDCGVHVIGKMSKDIRMGGRKGTVVSFVPTVFGCFLGIPSLYVFGTDTGSYRTASFLAGRTPSDEV